MTTGNRVTVEITFPDDFPMLDKLPRKLIVDSHGAMVVTAALAASAKGGQVDSKLVDFDSWRAERGHAGA